MSALFRIEEILFHGLLDYVIYFGTDLFVRRRLVVARSDTERCRIWQKMSAFLLIVSIFIACFHHKPYFLWILISVTVLLTLPLEYRNSKVVRIFHGCYSWLKYRLRSTPLFRDSTSGPPKSALGTVAPENQRKYQNGHQGLNYSAYRQDVVYSTKDHFQYSPSRAAFNCSMAEFSPFSRRPLHREFRDQIASQSSGYGESELSPASSSEFTSMTPIRRGYFATSTPVGSWYVRNQSPGDFRH